MNKKQKLALALAAVLSITPLTGCDNDKPVIPIEEQIESEDLYETFLPGEHIVSVKITEDLRDKITQHEYHEGYKPVSIASFTYGRLGPCYSGTIITYINTDIVKCKATEIKDGKVEYGQFGTVVEKKETTKKDNKKILMPYEHIITVPITVNGTHSNPEIDFIEGYELIGVEFVTYGRLSCCLDDGYALYVNTVPVECSYKYEDETTTFDTIGKPVEESKKLTLEQ